MVEFDVGNVIVVRRRKCVEFRHTGVEDGGLGGHRCSYTPWQPTAWSPQMVGRDNSYVGMMAPRLGIAGSHPTETIPTREIGSAPVWEEIGEPDFTGSVQIHTSIWPPALPKLRHLASDM